MIERFLKQTKFTSEQDFKEHLESVSYTHLSIYKAFNHQHVPEIRQSLKQTQGYLDAAIDFIPYRGDFARGIFATEVVKTDKPIEEIVAGYKAVSYTHLNVEIELNPDLMAISGKGKFVDFNKFSAYCIR